MLLNSVNSNKMNNLKVGAMYYIPGHGSAPTCTFSKCVKRRTHQESYNFLKYAFKHCEFKQNEQFKWAQCTLNARPRLGSYMHLFEMRQRRTRQKPFYALKIQSNLMDDLKNR